MDAAQGKQTIETFFAQVRARPGMFLPDHSLALLEAMVQGYSAALHAHGIEELGTNFNRRFSTFVFEALGWSTSRGWADAITSHCLSPEAAFERFFLLLEQFRHRP